MKILIIVPCYNEASRLDTNAFYEFSLNNPNVHFLFVNDGSTDNILQLLQILCNKHNNLNYITSANNVGKAEALRSGVMSIKNKEQYNFIGYFDADLSVPLNEIQAFLEVIKKREKTKFIFGMRIARLGAKINRNLLRHYLGRVFATFVSIILKEPIYDSQCGAKLIHSSIIFKLFEKPFISKWLFDVELLSRFKMLYPNYMNQIVEYPISEWNEISGSKLKIKHYLLAPFELFKIWLKYRKFLK